MPWLTTYSDETNRIDEAQESIVTTVTNISNGKTYRATDTVTRYAYVGMDLATAQDCQADLNDPPAVIAEMQRGGDGGNYRVNVAEITYGSWEEVT